MTHQGAKAKLKRAAWLKRAETQEVFALLDGKKGRTRVVGGTVRDTLLGRMRDGAEIDFATEFVPDDVMARAKNAGITAIPTGIDHGTVTLKINDDLFEVTTLREDVATDGRHAEVAFGTDWVRDAERRDFTMNALYAGMDGTLFDPLSGLGDCLAGKVQFIGDPDRRIAEDRLRVYRFFRFTASHGAETLDKRGLEACVRAAGDLGDLSAERVGAEMLRIFELPRAAATVRAMVKAGILSIETRILRELATYESCTDVPLAAGRLGLLLEQFGTIELQRMWRLSNAEMKAAGALRDAGLLLGAGQINEVAYRFPDVSKSAIPVAAAIHDWSHDWQDEITRMLRTTRVPPFPIKGQDLVDAGLSPGPALGRQLHALEREWIDSGFRLTRDELLTRVGD